MSYLRPSRGGEIRRSVFYTASNEDWELVESPTKDTPEQKQTPESQRRESPSNLHRSKNAKQTILLKTNHIVIMQMIKLVKLSNH